MQIERINKSYEKEVIVGMEVVRIRTTFTAILDKEEQKQATAGVPGAMQFIDDISHKLYRLAKEQTERDIALEKEKQSNG